jgi:tRNA (adenine22-N1)-methyltransferase
MRGLPLRLQAILPWLTAIPSLVDIGSDHGLLPYHLWKSGNIPLLYASELTASSYATLKNALLTTSVQTYKADGLDALPAHISTVVITGMGGYLIRQIIEKGHQHWSSIDQFILGPQKDIAMLRQYLSENAFIIVDETFVTERGKGYIFLRVKQGHESLNALQCTYGPRLLEILPEAYVQYVHQKEANHPLYPRFKQWTESKNKL